MSKCGMWTDIRVYTLETKAEAELSEQNCTSKERNCTSNGFCTSKEIMKPKKKIENYEKASEKLEEITQSLDKTKETNQYSSNAVPSKMSFTEVVSSVNQEKFNRRSAQRTGFSSRQRQTAITLKHLTIVLFPKMQNA